MTVPESTSPPLWTIRSTLKIGASNRLIRFSPHYYNGEDEIDQVTELVGDLAT